MRNSSAPNHNQSPEEIAQQAQDRLTALQDQFDQLQVHIDAANAELARLRAAVVAALAPPIPPPPPPNPPPSPPGTPPLVPPPPPGPPPAHGAPGLRRSRRHVIPPAYFVPYSWRRKKTRSG